MGKGPPSYWVSLAGLLLVCFVCHNHSRSSVMPLLPSSHAASFAPVPARRSGTMAGFTGAAAPMPFLMSSVACRDGEMWVPRRTEEESESSEQDAQTTKEYALRYRIFRPMSLSSQQAAPVVVLHGGPSVPSDYLYPLVDVIPYRSMIFFDQIGCGRSSIPTDLSAYSISNAVDDLELLLKKLNVRRFHLYGQSYGGILAFEYCKRVAERKGATTNNNNDEEACCCLSVILSSAPTSVSLVETEVHRLLDELKKDEETTSTATTNDDEEMEEEDTKALWERFRIQHQVRTPEMPLPLVDAYAHAGTIWRGTAAIPDYVASPPSPNAARLPSAMILRGQHDFVTCACTQDWGSAFHHPFVRQVVLAGCAHHGLLEQPRLYGDTVDSFFSEYD
eukprot:scaffold13544_cov50-Attheya_sp.AAC.6